VPVLLRLAAFLAALCAAAPAVAQQEDLRARQRALFEALFDKPDDPALMLDYVRVSIALDDNEAAISTLERALIYRPDDPAIMVELGAAYFRLGSWGVAEHHFRAAREAGLPPDVEERVDEFLAAIADRSRRSRFGGTATAGLAASTNANLGVDDRVIRFFGLPAVIGTEFESQADEGFRATLDLSHAYDLGGPTGDAWRTDLSLYTLDFFETDAGDIDSLSIATGPTLSLDQRAFGPKVRPFALGRVVRSAGEPFFTEYGGGIEYDETLDRHWSTFLRMGAGRRDYASDFQDFDAYVFRGLGGAAYTVRPGATLYATALLEAESAADDAQSNIEAGARLSGVLDYDPGLPFTDEKATLSGYLQVSARGYDQPDPVVDPEVTRDDLDVLVGAAHVLRLGDGVGVRLDVDALRRESNIDNFDLESVTGVVSLVYEF
jgi:hypothetical protein